MTGHRDCHHGKKHHEHCDKNKHVKGDLKVSGKTTLKKEVKACGDATFKKNIEVCGDILLKGELIQGQKPCKPQFFTDFREELSCLATCNPSLFFPTASPTQPFTGFGPLDPNYCEMTSQGASEFRVAGNSLAATDDKTNFWSVGPGIGIRSDETFRYELKGHANVKVNSAAALAAFGAANLVEGNPSKDVRLTSSGLVTFFVDDSGLQSIFTVCFFFSETAVWAFHDVFVNLTAPPDPPVFPNQRFMTRGEKIADYDTSEEHVYRGEYDRKNRLLKWYIDDELKLTLPLGGAPSKVSGVIYRDWGGLMDIPLVDAEYVIPVAVAATAFRNGGIWPAVQGLEPSSPPFIIPPWNFPTSSIQGTYQDFQRDAAIVLKEFTDCTYKSE